MKSSLLIIDDDRLFCDASKEYLVGDKFDVFTAHNGKDGLDICRSKKIDVVLLDQKLPDGDGYLLCRPILLLNELTKIIFITAYPSFENALQALRAGAYDYLSKPLEPAGLNAAIGRALHVLELERADLARRYQAERESESTVLVGEGLAGVRRLVELAASSDAPVLISGETGSGKGVAARCIHLKGKRREAPFIGINCAALPEGLIEAELFGHEKGAFTGAASAKKGVFELAEGGTLFLDEIGQMPLHLQAKLLTAIEEKTIKRLGSESARHVDVRIAAASNSELEGDVIKGAFRKDLYYRLNVIRIHMPALRERAEDIKELCKFFLGKMAVGHRFGVPDEEFRKLARYGWPGNVRELKNVIERAVVLKPGPLLKLSELLEMPALDAPDAPDVTDAGLQNAEGGGIATLEQVERAHIIRTFHKMSGNAARTARELDISLSTLKRKMKLYKVAPTGLIGPK